MEEIKRTLENNNSDVGSNEIGTGYNELHFIVAAHKNGTKLIKEFFEEILEMITNRYPKLTNAVNHNNETALHLAM